MANLKLPQDQLKRLKNEIAMAEAFNDQELRPRMEESLLRYCGKFIPTFGQSWDILLNEIYPIVQFYLPNIFFRNPKAYVKPKTKTHLVKQTDPITGQKVEIIADSSTAARTQEATLNWNLEKMRYKSETRKVAMDALLFLYGVLWHGYKGNFGMTEEQSLYIKKESIFAKRISPINFIWDPCTSLQDIENARWVGRIEDVPLQDILENEKLDVDKKQIKGFEGFGQEIGQKPRKDNGGQDALPLTGKTKSLINFASLDFKESDHCRFVKVREVFLRPTPKEEREGSKGWIVLLTDEQDKPLRVSPWSIKAEGFPAKILEFNPVPDQRIGLSDIDVYKTIADQKNIIVNLQVRNAQENSKVWVALAKGDVDAEEDIDKIKVGDQTIIMFEGDNVNGKMSLQSPSGMASSELYLIDQRIQRNLEDKSGVSDLKKGFLQSGEESATSVKIRNAGSSARPQYRQDIMKDFLTDSFNYINDLERQYFTVQDVVRIVGSLDIEWSEKPSREALQAETDVEIDAISMLPEDPQKEIVELREVIGLMVQAIGDPMIREKLQQEGKTVNLTPLIEQLLYRLKVRDPNVFRNVTEQDQDRMVKASQLKEAQANIQAVITGQQLPVPPSENDDHIAKIETYSAFAQIMQMFGQQIEGLEQLIAVQSELLQQKQEQEARPGTKVNLKPQAARTT